MHENESVSLTRDVEASVVPVGTKVTLQQGEQAYITQSLGGAYTVVVNGNMFRIDGKDADALGLEPAAKPKNTSGQPRSKEELEKEVWSQLKTCYDPEIPVNVVDLGLIYDCQLAPISEGKAFKADVKMTLTAPGCGMGEVLVQDVREKVEAIPTVERADVELVFDPPWDQSMMSEEARLEAGLL